MGSSLALALSMLLLFPISLHATDELISLLPKATVSIVNELGGPVLGLHCRSKEDDLGVHIIQSDQSYSFTFRPNVWGTTLYYCSFEWVRGEAHYFTIYDFRRDAKSCTFCKWLIYPSGPCLQHFNGTETSITCSPWNKSNAMKMIKY